MKLKITRYVLGIYAFVLLASLAVFYLFPKENLTDFDFSPGSEAKHNLYREAAFKGELDQLEEVQLYRQWSFNYPLAYLEITGDEASPPIRIRLKRTPAGTGKIEAAEYRREISLPDFLKPYRVTLTGNRLAIHGPGNYRINYKGYVEDFTAGQFKKRNRTDQSEYIMQLFAEFEFAQELYLYLPAEIGFSFDPESVNVEETLQNDS